MRFSAAIITISDKGSKGEREDKVDLRLRLSSKGLTQ